MLTPFLHANQRQIGQTVIFVGFYGIKIYYVAATDSHFGISWITFTLLTNYMTRAETGIVKSPTNQSSSKKEVLYKRNL